MQGLACWSGFQFSSAKLHFQEVSDIENLSPEPKQAFGEGEGEERSRRGEGRSEKMLVKNGKTEAVRKVPSHGVPSWLFLFQIIG